MNLRIATLGLIVSAALFIPAPAFAHHEAAQGVFCAGSDYSNEGGFSRMINGPNVVIYSGGVPFEDGDGDDGVGMRITADSIVSAAFATTGSGDSDPFVFYTYTTNGSNELFNDSGVTSTTHGGQTFWFFHKANAGLPRGSVVTELFLADFGQNGDGGFTVKATHITANGVPVHPLPGSVSDCDIID
jgi:hypothetical protein